MPQLKILRAGTPTPVVITVYGDRTFTFVTKAAPVSYLLKKAAKIAKGSTETGKKASVGSVTKAQIMEIAKLKIQDMNANDLNAAGLMIEGTAISMGLEVEQ